MDTLLTTRKLALDKGEPKARTDYEDRFERSLLAGSGKTIVARWTFNGPSAGLGQARSVWLSGLSGPSG